MQKLMQFFGFTQNTTKPANNEFSITLVWFPVIIINVLAVAITNIPDQGAPSPLAALNPSITGGANWITTENLPTWLTALHWATYFMPYLIYTATATLLFFIVFDFYKTGRFTEKTKRKLPPTILGYAVAILIYQLLFFLTQTAALNLNHIPDGIKQGYTSGEGLLQFFIFAFLSLINAAISKAQQLQEDTDATI